MNNNPQLSNCVSNHAESKQGKHLREKALPWLRSVQSLGSNLSVDVFAESLGREGWSSRLRPDAEAPKSRGN